MRLIGLSRRSSSLTRTLLKWGLFTSTDDLTREVLTFIAYCTVAKSFTWTYQGKALAV